LEWLDLSDNDLGPVAGQLLGASAHASQLRYLDVSLNRTFGDRGVKALARSPRFGGLRVLRLVQCGLTPAGIAAAGAAGWLANLAWLELGGSDIGVGGINVLASAPLQGLRKLRISRARLASPEARALAKCPWLGGLSHLELENNTITDAGTDALAEALDPKQIAYLSLAGNRIGANGKRRLRRRFGERVQWRQPWEI
jgi:Ran GTPase-activating protein (RanGAP) involved in mRNA processing and transport